MKITIIVVGKLKERYLKDGVAEYLKRLGRFAKCQVIELADEKTPDKASLVEQEQILECEGRRILDKLSERSYLVALAIEGKTLSSEEFSQKLSDITLNGQSEVTFVIGGSLGLSPVIKNKADLLWSFGKITLPHQLMRLVLTEQIYRAFMIKEGSPYHK